jgi:hypothetical protein
MDPIQNKTQRSPLKIIGAVVVLGIILILCWYKLVGPGSSQTVTFTNTAYGYSITYPKRWSIVKSGKEAETSSLFMIHDDVKSIAITEVPNPQELQPKQWYERNTREHLSDLLYPYPAAIVADEEDTTLNGLPAFKVTTNEAAHNFDYFVTRGPSLFVINVEIHGDTDKLNVEAERKELLSILDTLNFLGK